MVRFTRSLKRRSIVVGHDGIVASDSPPATLTGNTADFNDAWGIYSTPPQTDGGTNKAQGNTQHEQCYAVVCSPS
jgi:hypothetical protein